MKTIQEQIAEAKTIEEVVFLAMGFASTCWDEEKVFESQLCKDAGDAAVKRIGELILNAGLEVIKVPTLVDDIMDRKRNDNTN